MIKALIEWRDAMQNIYLAGEDQKPEAWGRLAVAELNLFQYARGLKMPESEVDQSWRV